MADRPRAVYELSITSPGADASLGLFWDAEHAMAMAQADATKRGHGHVYGAWVVEERDDEGLKVVTCTPITEPPEGVEVADELPSYTVTRQRVR